MKNRIVYNKLLRGWFIVRGAHDTPIGGRFETKAAAEAWLNRKDPGRLPEGVIAMGLENPETLHNTLKTLLGDD